MYVRFVIAWGLNLGGSGVIIFIFRPTQIEGLPSACQTFQDASKALPDGENLNIEKLPVKAALAVGKKS